MDRRSGLLDIRKGTLGHHQYDGRYIFHGKTLTSDIMDVSGYTHIVGRTSFGPSIKRFVFTYEEAKLWEQSRGVRSPETSASCNQVFIKYSSDRNQWLSAVKISEWEVAFQNHYRMLPSWREERTSTITV